ncbi:MAG: metal-sulfur cluster assembly factor [Lutibacter sp.]|mgnify:CR=1 FL=1|jgi:metal-sulfur cluster biosynthetic enzyme|uniref:metal-sulfur cluster assembly factor n=1 Tax=Lutibacter sp. TaxID=1925666 RepID=UPI00299D63DE|nr:metal-sulfur cluster assembly factor [Lutibacter sp.]MDX1829250.1 metal-sulfur cluster assembly factor [Lutibacter sp.]
MNTTNEKLIELLKEVIDPELMVNIVDLGLVYGVTINESTHEIDVDLTLTSPGCPMGDMITEDAKQLINANYPTYETEIHLVWDPVWSIEKLTEKGKEELGYF